MPHC